MGFQWMLNEKEKKGGKEYWYNVMSGKGAFFLLKG